MMGVDIVLKSSSTKARKKMIARGVAGRNMVGDVGRVQTSVVVVVVGRATAWPGAGERAVGAPRRG